MDHRPTILQHKTQLADAFMNATKEYGYDGRFEIPHLTQRNGKRWTMAHQGSQRNHQLVLNAFVMHLLFDRTSRNRVTGLVYEKNGFEFEVLATKGVILSAGKEKRKLNQLFVIDKLNPVICRHDRYTTDFTIVGNWTKERANQCHSFISQRFTSRTEFTRSCNDWR